MSIIIYRTITFNNLLILSELTGVGVGRGGGEGRGGGVGGGGGRGRERESWLESLISKHSLGPL